MPHEVIMPALGMAQDTGLIVSWMKSPGDAVKAGDALFEVETDKATMEVEAPVDGFLTDVQAEAGAEVPVGNVIALISDTAEDSGSVAHAAPAKPGDDETALPDGKDVIMPALGMAQDTGLLVAWHKAPGDMVASGDILFEVETDKSTMEVEAGHDGYVAALLVEAGEEAPVGDPIAIISTDKPDAPVQRSQSGTAKAAAVAPKQAPKEASPPKAAKTPQKPAAGKAPAPQSGDRILASPKARRLALEQGLDLARLVEAGHPQPYHVSDLEVLKPLPVAEPVARAGASRHLTADLAVDGFAEFATWAAETAGLQDPRALMAGLAAASLGRDANVAVESLGDTARYAAPLGPLASVTAADPDTAPDLTLRDLRMSRISGVELGPEDTPVLTLTRTGDGLKITLECASHQMTAHEAVALLSNFAGRIEQPLRHLL
jgi:pyruvate/2-oxoglutarate dehydrogenase complex dihydrolipoamide acyltransferase (E2) component